MNYAFPALVSYWTDPRGSFIRELKKTCDTFGIGLNLFIDSGAYSAFTSGSKKFLDSLLLLLREEAGVEGGSYDSSSLSLRFGKRDTLRIGNYIYRNDPELFLLRKREKFY